LAGIAHDISGRFKVDDYQQVNYRDTRNLHEVFINSKASTFVFISSIKAVVDHTNGIIDENFVPKPASEYGKSKRKAEEFITKNARKEKKHFILRPCMIHGPGNKGNLNLLYRFVKTGIPYPLGAFKNKRSFLSIENFCFVIQKIIEEQLKSGTYLLSDDDPVSTNEVVRIIGRGLDKKVRILHLPKAIILSLARIGSWTQAPFNTSTVAKLCENMVVSNQKLLLNLKAKLPVSSIDGLMKTIKSFNE
jgi:nucleoside-diphosphate-sugar epimerase